MGSTGDDNEGQTTELDRGRDHSTKTATRPDSHPVASIDLTDDPSGGYGHRFTLAEAAIACGRAERTIRRAIDAGKMPNARMVPDPNGTRRWDIPLSDLLAAGYDPRNGGTADTVTVETPDDDAAETDELRRLREQNAELAKELAVAQARVEGAVALADERKAHIDRMADAMRMLTAAPTPQPAHATQEPVSEPAPARYWWGGRRR